MEILDYFNPFSQSHSNTWEKFKDLDILSEIGIIFATAITLPFFIVTGLAVNRYLTERAWVNLNLNKQNKLNNVADRVNAMAFMSAFKYKTGTELVKILNSSSKIDLSLADTQGNTLFHIACARSKEAGFEHLIGLMLGKMNEGEDQKNPLDAMNNRGKCPLEIYLSTSENRSNTEDFVRKMKNRDGLINSFLNVQNRFLNVQNRFNRAPIFNDFKNMKILINRIEELEQPNTIENNYKPDSTLSLCCFLLAAKSHERKQQIFNSYCQNNNRSAEDMWTLIKITLNEEDKNRVYFTTEEAAALKDMEETLWPKGEKVIEIVNKQKADEGHDYVSQFGSKRSNDLVQIIKQGPKKDVVDNRGNTPFHRVCGRTQIDVKRFVRMMWEAGFIGLDKQNNTYTLPIELYRATHKDDLDFQKEIIARMEDPKNLTSLLQKYGKLIKTNNDITFVEYILERLEQLHTPLESLLDWVQPIELYIAILAMSSEEKEEQTVGLCIKSHGDSAEQLILDIKKMHFSDVQLKEKQNAAVRKLRRHVYTPLYNQLKPYVKSYTLRENAVKIGEILKEQDIVHVVAHIGEIFPASDEKEAVLDMLKKVRF